MLRRLSGLLALVALAMVAYGFSNTQKMVDAKYRWHLQTTTAASTNIKIRFPKKELLNNAIPTAANSRTVHFVELIQYDLTANSDFVVWSRAFPEGLDTVRVNQNLRTKILSGFPVDSLEYIGTLSTPFIGVSVAGVY